jgi:hypothetical protein
VRTTNIYRYDGGKTVFVRSYLRLRFGDWETVVPTIADRLAGRTVRS